MQYEIRGMSSRSGRVSDTMPKRGRVNEEWLVHEDEALAYQLQKREVEEHYTGNRSRNAQVREDYPKAKSEQEKEKEKAMERSEMIKQQAEMDLLVAQQMMDKLKMEEEKKRALETHDKMVAKRIQDKEMVKREGMMADVERYARIPDVNVVGIPTALVNTAEYENVGRNGSVAMSHNQRNVKVGVCGNSWREEPVRTEERHGNLTAYVGSSREPVCLMASSMVEQHNDVESLFTDEELTEELARIQQEEKDEELARTLYEQEKLLQGDTIFEKDRMLAIEAQDKELAKLLQERERAKLRRAKERAKQRALLKKQMRESEDTIETEHNYEVPSISRSRQRYDHNDESDIDSSPPVMQNVAIAIDPTYSQGTDSYYSGNETAPPYMPIQGQRRSTGAGVVQVEKKSPKKSKVKDGCKQQ